MRLPDNPELNLTSRTLLSTVKYYVPQKVKDEIRLKKLLYQEDLEFL